MFPLVFDLSGEDRDVDLATEIIGAVMKVIKQVTKDVADDFGHCVQPVKPLVLFLRDLSEAFIELLLDNVFSERFLHV